MSRPKKMYLMLEWKNNNTQDSQLWVIEPKVWKERCKSIPSYKNNYSIMEKGSMLNNIFIDDCIGNKWQVFEDYSAKYINNTYYTEFQSICPEDDCNGRVDGSGYADNDSGEIVKFEYQECRKCGWNQGS